MVKTYLYNARSKRPVVEKAAGRHKASALRLWKKDNREEIKKHMPEVAGDREITKTNWLAIYSEAANVLWEELDEEKLRDYEELAEAINSEEVSVEEQRR